MNTSLVSIVIPVYNEQEAIVPVVTQVREVMEGTGRPYEIIIVDDGSTDGSADVARSLPDVQVVSHRRNRGTGAARTTGTQAAKGDLIVMTDADGTYPADAIPDMLDALDTDCDMVIGARTREMGTVKWLRSLAKNAIRLLASYMTATRIPDLNSGLRAMKRDLVIRFLPILPTTHSWVSTITMAFLSSDLEVRWIPISYHKRIGKSTFHPLNDTYNYLMLVVRAIMYFNPLRIFLPVSLTMLAFGFGKAIYDIINYSWHLAPSTLMVTLTGVQLLASGLLAELIVRRTRL